MGVVVRGSAFVALAAVAASLGASAREPDEVALCRGETATIVASAGVTTVGTKGADVIVGTTGRDVIWGRGGDDLICARAGSDAIRGGAGDDVIAAGRGSDEVFGGPGHDVVFGGAGRDRLWGNRGGDWIFGGPGADEVRGGPGSDRLRGGRHNDMLLGNGGDDTLFGGARHDDLVGGPDGDTIDGDAGIDRCVGASGHDTATGCEVVATTEAGQAPAANNLPRPGAVALTFDDGPDPNKTPLILDALDAAGVRATFFVTGNHALEHPSLVRDMYRRGHSVQNHTMSHVWLTEYSDAGIRTQLEKANDVIENIIGSEPMCFRGPYDAVDSRVRRVAETIGMTAIDFDVDPWDLENPQWYIVQHVLEQAHDQAIVLLHETGPATYAAIGPIVAGLRQLGLELDTLCQ